MFNDFWNDFDRTFRYLQPRTTRSRTTDLWHWTSEPDVAIVKEVTIGLPVTESSDVKIVQRGDNVIISSRSNAFSQYKVRMDGKVTGSFHQGNLTLKSESLPEEEIPLK